MNAHIILVYRFPEDPDEIVMQYTADEFPTAKGDSINFSQMYPEVLYLQLFEVEDGLEVKVYEWINPQSEKLTRRASSVGDAMSGLPTIAGFVPRAGSFLPSPSDRSTPSQWGARPPLAVPSDSPSPTTSKTYGGLNRPRISRPPRVKSTRNFR